MREISWLAENCLASQEGLCSMEQASEQASKPASKRASKWASEQAGDRASKQASQQASEQASEQASKFSCRDSGVRFSSCVVGWISGYEDGLKWRSCETLTSIHLQ
jgi:hypothetical protein